ncbi:MAG: hypothetical protein ACYTFY_10460, partial [Planctomycetota bacterium]
MQKQNTIGNLHDHYINMAFRQAERDGKSENIYSEKEWQEKRPEIYKQFMISLGLENMPEKCEFKTKSYGKLSGKGWQAEKFAWQILPDCWA